MAMVLSEEQELLKDSARDFVKANAPVSHLRELRDNKDADGFSKKMWKEVAELGWAGILFSEEYGGAELGMAELGVIMEECGRTLAPLPILSSVVLGGCAVDAGGSDVLRKEILTGVCSGDTLLALALQETPRFAPYQVSTTGVKTDAGFEINGEKCFVLDGHVADHLVVVARSSGSPGDRDGLSLFLVDAGSDGLEITRTIMVDSRNAADFVFDGVQVGGDQLLGVLDEGYAPLEKALDVGRACLSAEMLGTASEAFERTLHYLKERKQFGVPIGSCQVLQHRAAHLFTEIEMLRSVVLKALQALQAGEASAAFLTSLAKAKAAQVCGLATSEAIQMHGGIGMTDEYEIGFFMKRSRVSEHTFGSSAFHRNRYGELQGY